MGSCPTSSTAYTIPHRTRDTSTKPIISWEVIQNLAKSYNDIPVNGKTYKDLAELWGCSEKGAKLRAEKLVKENKLTKQYVMVNSYKKAYFTLP
jgi:hypothetical protein